MREPGAEPSVADGGRERHLHQGARPHGVVRALHVEAPGKFEVGDADTMLEAL